MNNAPCNDEVDTDEEGGYCPTCSGSGEGMYEGSRCSNCGGSGEVSSGPSREDALADAADHYNDTMKDERYGYR